MKIYLKIEQHSDGIRAGYSYEKIKYVDDGFWSWLIRQNGKLLFFRGLRDTKEHKTALRIAKRLKIDEDNVH